MIDKEFRLDYFECRQVLLQRLQEPAPGRIQLLTGPRQVGKTTLALDLATQLGEATSYVAGDDPQANLPAFGNVPGLRPKQRVATAQECCSLMKFSMCQTGALDSKGSMIVSDAETSRSMWLSPAPLPFASGAERGRAWPGVLNA